MNVTITDAEKYKVVSLEKDETRTLTVKDGNYADADTSSVDTAVAGVTVTGKDVQDTYEKTVAQIATAMATFDGATVDLSKCMYTLESGSDSYTYKVKATAANGNGIYLGPKASSTAGIPNVTTAANITFEKILLMRHSVLWIIHHAAVEVFVFPQYRCDKTSFRQTECGR